MKAIEEIIPERVLRGLQLTLFGEVTAEQSGGFEDVAVSTRKAQRQKMMDLLRYLRPYFAAAALLETANDKELRMSGHSGISVRKLRTSAEILLEKRPRMEKR